MYKRVIKQGIHSLGITLDRDLKEAIKRKTGKKIEVGDMIDLEILDVLKNEETDFKTKGDAQLPSPEKHGIEGKESANTEAASSMPTFKESNEHRRKFNISPKK